jgi:CDP-diacylglycerol--glycerol-3-phosphate 3-phosphatidyltransferase
MIENLKPLYNATLRPFARGLHRIGFTPNKVTVTGTLLFLIASTITAFGHWHIGLAIGFIGALFDGMDGIIARECNLTSTFGAVLDSVCDRLTEIFWLAGLTWWYLTLSPDKTLGPMLCFAAATGSLMVSYVRARAEGAGISCLGGIMQRPERLIFLAVFQLLGPKVMLWGLGALAVLSWGTSVERIVAVYRAVREKK